MYVGFTRKDRKTSYHTLVIRNHHRILISYLFFYPSIDQPNIIKMFVCVYNSFGEMELLLEIANPSSPFFHKLTLLIISFLFNLLTLLKFMTLKFMRFSKSLNPNAFTDEFYQKKYILAYYC